MALLPTIDTDYSERDVTDTFLGYRHQAKISDGEFYNDTNLTTSYYPLLANRKKRGVLAQVTSGGTVQDYQGILAKEYLAYVAGGTLYYNGTATAVTGLSTGKKQLVSMGAYICIFPDKKYYNTADSTDYGSMEASYTSTGNVKYRMCKLDGTEYATPTISDTEPASPSDGDLWIDTSKNEHVLRQYSSASGEWVSIQTVYTKITFVSEGELPGIFALYDGVTISGAAADVVNGDKVIYKSGQNPNNTDYIVVIGLLEQAVDQSSGTVSIQRKTPTMEYVVEAQNRLWGCHYGNGLNEIYCCALGDFKNWRQYMGLSTDSWTASVGSDGAWTGAVNYLGYPMFFKEDRIHKVSVSSTGAHSITETVCRGVENGSSESLAIVNETLLYKSRQDVCAYSGGFPSSISDALGDVKYSNAVAGAFGDKYYISMKNSANEYSLFVYDIKRGLWIREDDMNVTEFAALGDELYALSGNRLWALMGTAGDAEAYVPWEAESGMLYYEYPDRKYVSRFNLRLSMEIGAVLDTYIEYDSSGEWQHMSNIRFHGTNTITLPIRPRRCDHLRIKLCGKGEIRVYSLARILSIGSDVG